MSAEYFLLVLVLKKR